MGDIKYESVRLKNIASNLDIHKRYYTSLCQWSLYGARESES